MAFTMLAFVGIANRNLRYYLICMAIAGAIHMPSLVFLPAYWFCGIKVKPATFLFYLVLGIVFFTVKDQFVYGVLVLLAKWLILGVAFFTWFRVVGIV